MKECHNEDVQCAYIVDKIFEITSDLSVDRSSFGSIAILYRRQVKLFIHDSQCLYMSLKLLFRYLFIFILQASGKLFQKVFRNRKIPFNIHGVAFYRKKVCYLFFSFSDILSNIHIIYTFGWLFTHLICILTAVHKSIF